MDYEFDKEIDSLLRQARPDIVASGNFNAHVDADEISLFAENALTQKARMRVSEHLADCAKCRKILSNVIALNAGESSEIVHTEEPKPAITESAIPWYRRIFAFPQLAYTMGGLTVLLAGMIGYVMLQSYNESKSTSIAQMERSVERPRGTTGADSEGETTTIETYPQSAVNTAASNASNAAVTTANAAANIAAKPGFSGGSAVNSNSAAAPMPKKDEASVPPPPVSANSLAEREQITQDSAVTGENYSTDRATRAGAQPNYQQNAITRNQTQITPDSRNVQSRQIESLPMNGRAAPRVLQAAPPVENDDALKEKAEKKAEPEKTRNTGGKDFIYKDNVWYDKDYRQQKTVNVRRNSDDYKKLDAGLRSIADNLGGTVVIVWGGKAYRIQ